MLWTTFELDRVLDATQKHKAAPTHTDLLPCILEVLHIAIDEVQLAFDKMVPYGGSGSGVQSKPATGAPPLKPLSTGLNHTLQGTISQTHRFFVISTLSGMAARHMVEMLDMTDTTTASMLLLPLSPDTVCQVVASFGLEPSQPGQLQMVLRRAGLCLLTTTGGNPHMLECLKIILEDKGSPSGSLHLSTISSPSSLTKSSGHSTPRAGANTALGSLHSCWHLLAYRSCMSQ